MAAGAAAAGAVHVGKHLGRGPRDVDEDAGEGARGLAGSMCIANRPNPDVTYSGHKKGYEVQVAETCTRRTLPAITHVEVTPSSGKT